MTTGSGAGVDMQLAALNQTLARPRHERSSQHEYV
eukprot:CAMPEP_0119371896 /NCGR_PEP_ID=MMETSP1334-20130426/17979_1 /TAXON_ID=127549 /ORGANISM="Calcidiscus leptoporus, Strain RCC1130" /LENGTH=34 /DNA_ID= /DNA_START= /DNA_END= /DNA_ORIENTATION=